MAYYPLLVYVHILLMVFWLGTDIGVFVAGLQFMDPKRTLEQRSAVIGLGMIVDRFPRFCFVAIVPVGLQMSYARGLLPMSAGVMSLIWVLSAIWLAAVIAGFFVGGTPRGRPWRLLEKTFLVGGLIAFTVAAILAWCGQWLIPGWLAGKFFLFGMMCLFSLLLDRSFAPVFAVYGTIAARGSTPPQEAALASAYDPNLCMGVGNLCCGTHLRLLGYRETLIRWRERS